MNHRVSDSDKTLQGFSTSIGAATILAILGKVALEYTKARDANIDWFTWSNDHHKAQCLLLLSIFLVFFRGKMLHDDAIFFSELTKDGVFANKGFNKWLIKFGLIIGYLSWLFWAPAIFFLEDREKFVEFFGISIGLSTIWLLVDIATRINRKWKQVIWAIPNACYFLLLIPLQSESSDLQTITIMITILVIDWLVTDPLKDFMK